MLRKVNLIFDLLLVWSLLFASAVLHCYGVVCVLYI